MDTTQNTLRSPWLVAERELHTPLGEDLEVDVAVIGGGIVGVASAQYLADEGLSVALLEARTIGAGVTGNSTAKLSALPGTQYSQITSKHGDEPARAYARLNRAGVEAAFALAERHSVECRLERRPAFTYAEDEGNASDVADEADAARAAGLDVTVTRETDLPFEVAAAVRLDDQAQFDPAAWCRGVADAFATAGVRVFENTRAIQVRSRDSRLRVGTAMGAEVRCSHVVVATHMPFLDRGLYFARTGPKRSYAVAGPAGGPVPEGMYLSTDSPTRSIRSFTDLDGTKHVIVGGESGHGARPMEGDWVRSLRDQGRAAGVAFFGQQVDPALRVLPPAKLLAYDQDVWGDDLDLIHLVAIGHEDDLLNPDGVVLLELRDAFVDRAHDGAVARAVALRREVPLLVEPVHHLVFYCSARRANHDRELGGVLEGHRVAPDLVGAQWVGRAGELQRRQDVRVVVGGQGHHRQDGARTDSVEQRGPERCHRDAAQAEGLGVIGGSHQIYFMAAREAPPPGLRTECRRQYAGTVRAHRTRASARSAVQPQAAFPRRRETTGGPALRSLPAT